MPILNIEAHPIYLWKEDPGEVFRASQQIPEETGRLVHVSLEGYAPIDNTRAMAHLVTIQIEESE